MGCSAGTRLPYSCTLTPARPAHAILTALLHDTLVQLYLAIGDPLREQAQLASDQALRLTEFTRSLSAVSRRRRGRVRMEVGRVELDADAAIPSTGRAGSYVRLLVRDSGRGIPHDVLPHLFEPFYSTKGEEGSESTPGLALASVCATVTQYGGCAAV